MTKEQMQYNGAKIVSSIYGAGTTGHPRTKKKLDTSLILLRKINSKWTIGLNVKCKMLNSKKTT